MPDETERRRSRRYPVTLSARVSGSDRLYRAQILDVSTGGLLLSQPEDLLVETGTLLCIEAAMIGRLQARVVAVSKNGIHLKIEDRAGDYDASVQRLSKISRSW